jgi:hypothetical protein
MALVHRATSGSRMPLVTLSAFWMQMIIGYPED